MSAPASISRALASRFFFAGLASFILLASLPAAQAQALSDNSALGITVSPVRDEFTIAPGSTTTHSIKVVNPVSSIVTLYPQILNFTSNSTGDEPQFYSDAQRSSPFSIASWITPDKPFLRIAPGESDELTYTIKVPDTAEPGGHYGAILLSTEPPKATADNTQVSVVGLVGTLLLATVPGDIVHQVSIDSFDAPQYLTKGPTHLALTLNNHGNIHEDVQGEIKIRNWSGAIVATLPVNDKNSNILPESQRTFTNDWSFNWKTVGRYSATAALYYGDPEQQLTATRVFYVIPIWLMVTSGIILLLIILWIIRAKRRQRKYPAMAVPAATPKQPNKIVMR